jgi:hypothetical protein
MKAEKSKYDEQAEQFLSNFGLTVKMVQKGDRCPPWEDSRGCVHGDRYRVSIKRSSGGKALSFDFWNSLNDVQTGTGLSAYSVLASISSDAYCPDTFEDFCSEYGYDQDSRKAFSTFKKVSQFADKIKAFFTKEEIEALSEIQ